MFNKSLEYGRDFLNRQNTSFELFLIKLSDLWINYEKDENLQEAMSGKPAVIILSRNGKVIYIEKSHSPGNLLFHHLEDGKKVSDLEKDYRAAVFSLHSGKNQEMKELYGFLKKRILT
ncbi:MAG: hypothetical protein PQJ59_00825 [Spirochaetales bacterium]|nr:hypothetical protein [Spirochaetales bacterium]